MDTSKFTIADLAEVLIGSLPAFYSVDAIRRALMSRTPATMRRMVINALPQGGEGSVSRDWRKRFTSQTQRELMLVATEAVLRAFPERTVPKRSSNPVVNLFKSSPKAEVPPTPKVETPTTTPKAETPAETDEETLLRIIITNIVTFLRALLGKHPALSAFVAVLVGERYLRTDGDILDKIRGHKIMTGLVAATLGSRIKKFFESRR